MSYVWTQLDGPRVRLSDPNAADPVFDVPELLAGEDLVFEVTASDGTHTIANLVRLRVDAVEVVARQQDAQVLAWEDAITDLADDEPVTKRQGWLGKLWSLLFTFSGDFASRRGGDHHRRS